MKVICPYCGSKAILKDASYVYRTKKSEEFSKVWLCSRYPYCDSYVGCHKDTDIPMGRLANAKLRKYKRKAHKSFDVLWKSKLFSNRREAYKWLSETLDIPIDNCHIGMFDVKMCKKVIYVCDHFYNHL